jgi:predicted Zn-dependent peptidase
MDRNTPPAVHRITELSTPSTEIVDREGNTPVRVVPSDSEEWTAIDVVFYAGTAEEEKPLVATTCAGLLTESTRSYPKVAELIDFYGARIYASVGKDTTTLGMLCLSHHLERVIPVFSSVLAEPDFPDSEFRNYVDRAKAALTVNLERVEMIARLEFSKRYFGKTKYVDRFSPADYAMLSREDPEAFFRQNLGLEGAHIVVSGNRVAEATELLRKHAVSNAGKSSPAAMESVNPATDTAVVEKAGVVQSAIRMGGKAVDQKHPDFLALHVANTILGGYFGSRLMQNLREDKGFTYGVGSVINHLKDHSYLAISTQVGSKHTRASLDQIRLEMIRLGKEDVDSDELELVKNYIAGSLVKSCDGIPRKVSVLKSMVMHGLPNDFHLHFLEDLYAVSASEVREAAKKYLDPEKFTKVVAGQMD